MTAKHSAPIELQRALKLRAKGRTSAYLEAIIRKYEGKTK